MKTKHNLKEINDKCKKFIMALVLLLFVHNTKAQLSFTSGQSLGDFNNITVGDVNGDGYPDIVALYYKAPNKIWFNDGNGNFTSAESLGTGGNAVALADLDSDGDLDAFITDGGYMKLGKPSTVWMNDGKGNFTNSGQQLGNRYSTDVALADLDGDGDIDAFVCNHAFDNVTQGGHQIWLNDGKGQFTNSGQDLGNSYHTSVHMGDIDGDGDSDALVTANFNEPGVTNENEIWINDGTAHFTKKVLSNPYSNDLALTDIDKDDDLDILITYQNYVNNSNIGAKIFLNDGLGNFSMSTQGFDAVQYNGIALGDLNNDGKLDVMFANGNYNIDAPNKTWIGDGEGAFTKTDLSFGADDGILVKLADFNNDGKLDAVVGNKIWLNTTFDYLGQTTPGKTPTEFILDESNTLPMPHSCPSFSPHGDEVFWAVWSGEPTEWTQTIYHRKKINTTWSQPMIANFSGGEYSDKIPVFDDDGDRVYFSSDRPISGSGNPGDENIWYVDKTDSTWGIPQQIGSLINTVGADEGFLSISKNSALYFQRDDIIYSSAKDENGFANPVQLPATINMPNKKNRLPTISSEDSFLIFASIRDDSHSSGPNGYFKDLYVSFKNQGEWGIPKNMGENINTDNDEFFTSLSPDNKFLFFMRGVNEKNVVYWVSTDIIDSIQSYTEIKEIKVSGISIYPNPTTGPITISFGTSPVKEAAMEISNLDGRQIFSNIYKNTATATIDLTGYSKGIYLVKVFVDGETYNEKVILK